MRLHQLVAGLFLVIAASVQAAPVAKSIPADSMGLSKTSVFDTPEPQVYQYKGEMAGQNKVLPRAYLNAPPQIPHDIADFLPITKDNNMCIACHTLPDQWGKVREPGTATPIPPSHYTDLRRDRNKVTDHLINARFNCNQCHVPQANTTPLVENTFGKRSR
ncbi:MAG: nitrate reductase cytochrome c-type subunit [Gallionella sp.]|nr:nitrate reductase cytochrome c-type subunit [Gallionella sp.]MDD4946560.1 nitrate reductase cytochrome c-type subunit [Gallionella sp.]MDD5613180.1 nitrate reductase cytochrome c-type subunit [Gallionella sp.]